MGKESKIGNKMTITQMVIELIKIKQTVNQLLENFVKSEPVGRIKTTYLSRHIKSVLNELNDLIIILKQSQKNCNSKSSIELKNKEKNQETSFKKGKTSRGFHKIEFKDINGVECSVQDSSLATEEAIWFGVDDPDPEILLPNKGWVKYPVLEDVLFKSRMHLSIKQAAQLVRILNKFLETGSVGEED